MEELLKSIGTMQYVIIYGAGVMAKALYTCMCSPPFCLKLDYFMVTDVSSNPDQINGIPVVGVREWKGCRKKAAVLVAIMDQNYNEIQEVLIQEHYIHIVPVTFESGLWEAVRADYVTWLFQCKGRNFLKLENERVEIAGKQVSAVHIYQVKSHYDQQVLTSNGYQWEIPIQAGAALTGLRIAAVRDDKGDNISEKNASYCELTALYWIWKNDKSKYLGLCHYRRHFNLSAEVLAGLEDSDIDVVLTVPILNFPDVKTRYCSDHIQADWDIMMKAIKLLHPEYSMTAEIVQQGVFYYGYNMLIARKEILGSYCAWLFPILAYCEEKCEKKYDRYQSRYIGFLAERLLTIYFCHHQNHYKIVHAKKIFLK